MFDAKSSGATLLECSLDLERSVSLIELEPAFWTWDGRRYPYVERWKERTIYHWTGGGFEPVSRYSGSLIKLVPTEWGPPTFEIDGIKMLPTAHVSPYVDAERKVNSIQPRGKVVLDTCGGLGYFAAWCLRGQAARVLSFEKNLDVIWLRSLNPWSPSICPGLTLTHADIIASMSMLADGSVDAVLHDPPRFGIAGELYSQDFYHALNRVLKLKGRLFHYTGTPNKIGSGRDLPREVTYRLQSAGFTVKPAGDGLLAVKIRSNYTNDSDHAG